MVCAADQAFEFGRADAYRHARSSDARWPGAATDDECASSVMRPSCVGRWPGAAA